MPALIVVAVIVVLLIIFVIGVYNALIRLRNQVDNSWSQIDVQLKRRHDLIPNLVETAKGYMKHERNLRSHYQCPKPGYGGQNRRRSLKSRRHSR